MTRTILAAAAASCLLLLGLSATASAAWEPYFDVDQVLVETTANIEHVEVLAAGDGGFFVVWSEFVASGYRTLAQYVDADGNPQWNAAGVTLLEGGGTYDVYDAVVSGGDLWVASSRLISTVRRTFVQRVGTDGSPDFALPGIDVAPSTSADTQDPAIAADGAGGVVVGFMDYRFFNTTSIDVWVQRIDASGSRLWSGWGTSVTALVPGVQGTVRLAPGADGSTLIFWTDYRADATSGSDVWGQRLDAAGDPLWAATGEPIFQRSGDQSLSSVASDGDGGALVAWLDNGGADPEVWCERIDPLDGSPLWGAGGGITICDASGHRSAPQVVGDGDGGAYVAWRDDRLGSNETRVYAQHVRPLGATAWTSNGTSIFARSGDQGSLTIAATPQGELLAATHWSDVVLATKIDGEAGRLWGSAGLVISSWSNRGASPGLGSDGTGGAVAGWRTDPLPEDSWDLAIRRLDAWGLGGIAAPAIAGVQDRPNDQGGQTIVEWDPSVHDTDASPVVDSYSVWMRLPDGAAKRSPAAVAEVSGLPVATVSAILASGWAWVGSQPALRFDLYAMNAPTYGDSTSAGVPLTEYQVVSHDEQTGGFWVSSLASGYSVDNLSPAAPLALAGALAGADVELDWSAGGLDEADLAGYRIYRGAQAGVTPENGELLATVTDLAYTDAAPPAGPKHYVVTAVDVHDNQSAPSNEVVLDGATSVEGSGLPAVFALRGATPNPFNPSTEIRLDVPRTDRVRVELFDARGARVRTLHDGPLAAGRRTLTWRGLDDDGRALPSGVYLARATVGDRRTSLKLTLAR